MSILEFHCSLQNNGINNETGLRIDNTGNRNTTNTDNAGKNGYLTYLDRNIRNSSSFPPKERCNLKTPFLFSIRLSMDYELVSLESEYPR